MNQKQATLISFLQEAGARNNNYWSNQNFGENETYGTNCIKPTKPRRWLVYKTRVIVHKCRSLLYLTIIPRVRVGYEMVEGAKLAIIISYPTSVSGIFVLLKTPPQNVWILPDFICKNNRFSACFFLEPKRTVTIFGEHGIMAHIPWWLSQSEL